MNYLKEIVGFERLAELKGLGPGERAMWYAFMSIANALGWPESFNVPNLTLQSKTGLTRKQVYDTRNRLMQKGFITYKQAGGNKAPVYTLVSTITEDDSALRPPVDTQTVHKRYTSGDTNGTQQGTQTVHNPGPYYKLNETKPNKEDVVRVAFTVTDEEAQAHREMIERIEAKAKDYGLPFATGDITKAINLAGEYTEDWLLQAIDRCSDRTSRNWGMVKGILRSWRENGGIDDAYQNKQQEEPKWA